MKADVTLAGDTIHVVIENPERKQDGLFQKTFELPVDTVILVSLLRELANEIEDYAREFPGAAGA